MKQNNKKTQRAAIFIIVLAAIVIPASIFYQIASGSHSDPSNISTDPAEHWAWNDVLKWIDFSDVTVKSKELTGYASSSIGLISLNCADLGVCGTSDYKVINDGAGFLFGYGWNDNIGWVSFCGGGGANPSCPGNIYYEVKIDGNGFFENYAWNDLVGWISFNCRDLGGQAFCGSTSDYKVKTSWFATPASGYLESTTFDTERTGGVQINSILWQGIQPAGTVVRFRIAASNDPNGPWTDNDFKGSDGTNQTYYEGGVGISIPVHYLFHNNNRYFRYRVYVFSDITQSYSPRVDSVIVNWSP